MEPRIQITPYGVVGRTHRARPSLCTAVALIAIVLVGLVLLLTSCA